jgi:hypothetical protein
VSNFDKPAVTAVAAGDKLFLYNWDKKSRFLGVPYRREESGSYSEVGRTLEYFMRSTRAFQARWLWLHHWEFDSTKLFLLIGIHVVDKGEYLAAFTEQMVIRIGYAMAGNTGNCSPLHPGICSITSSPTSTAKQ